MPSAREDEGLAEPLCPKSEGDRHMNRASESLASTRASFLKRRWFLRECGVGLAGIAASSLLAQERRPATGPATAAPVRRPHFAPKAKSIIYLFHAGAP